MYNAMANEPFRATFRCYPVAFANKEALEAGDKILLPPSVLDALARRRVTYPMMFRLTNPATGKATHVGVMEFSSEEGVAYVPYWVMQNLLVEGGGVVNVENVTLQKGSFVMLQPHSVRFTELSNPRVVLEKALRGFSCLTEGDTIKIMADEISHYLDVVEVRPGKAVSVIETDVNVDFAPPKDLKAAEERDAAKARQAAEAMAAEHLQFHFGADTGAHAPDDDEKEAAGAAAGPSSYFQALGKGHSLKASKKGKRKKSRKGSEPAAAPAAAAEAAPPAKPAAPKRRVEDQGRFRYIYETDAATGKERLVRRLPRPKTADDGDAAAAAEGGTSKKPGFTPFSGSGHKLT